ncbi:T9SS type A sorting domain-containing protein [Lewinella sp. W8]|uniref:T9SS type A sorting domain-containing protein n=1 Tax=Lewinella sp. W8 TaxID=2528208 RepID=UPI0010674730|nr:T9SS type A sorting domain-containing protein [Lewinella sp. W8]MTB50591.1 T9SS type A sorting domain-containing protein [Lewinella sp. W8]
MLKHFYSGLLLSVFFALTTQTALAQTPSSTGTRSCQDDSEISVAFTGETEIATCTDDEVMDRIRFQVVPFRQAFAYVVVDANDIILSIDFSNRINFDLLPPGQLRVYAFSTYGRITADVGDVFSTATLSTPCFGLTTNFVSVNNGQTGEATIATDTGEEEITVCPGDGEPDIVNVTSTTTSTNTAFVVTDEAGVILDLNDTGAIDFDGAGAGVCRIYAFGYEGDLPVTIGDNVSALVGLGTCGGGLSPNFITVTRLEIKGGTVSTTEGESIVRVCPNDDIPDVVSFMTTGNVGSNSGYIITDEANVIIGLPTGNSEDFNEAPVGICRVWAVSYEGELTATIGEPVSGAVLATSCFALSSNFVEVRREIPEGGTIATVDGETEVLTCPGDGNADIVDVVATGATGGDLVYLLTDDNNNILGFSEEPSFDLDGAPEGTCRIWTLSYQGNLTFEIGDNAATTDLSDNCFALSDNFVTVVRIVPVGGTVATADGETSVRVCPGDNNADIVEAVLTGSVGGEVVYLVTDENNVVLTISESATFDLDDSPVGNCRIWALTYQGNLTVSEGDNAGEVDLADDCFALSDNFIAVERITPVGGTVATVDGEDEVLICPGDGNADIVEVVVDGASGGDQIFVITDDNNLILDSSESPMIDLDGAPEGTCRIWNLTYQGNLIFSPGGLITSLALADDCFSLSSNFVTVVREIPRGGTIATVDGETEVRTCPGDGNADVIEVVATGNSGGELVYLLTDENNIIQDFSNTPSFDLESLGVGVSRIWALTYQGSLIFAPGDNAGEVDLADDCFALSDNFVTVVRAVPAGGTVATVDGETELFTCPGDGVADVYDFVSTGADATNFIFVITDAENNILDVSTDGTIDFEGAGVGVCRVWGLAYEGELLAEVGDNAAGTPLATGCFALSDNFVTVRREEPTGGTVRLESGATATTLCPGDGIADILTFVSTGATATNEFAFIITDENGVVISLPASGTIDFEDAPVGLCRVYGLSYSGDVLLNEGDNINEVQLATECAALSDNFVTVDRIEATTGPISLEDGGLEALICPGDLIPDPLFFDSTGTSLERFNYIVTDTNNVLIQVAFTDRINFETFPEGVCRVWGLGYNGLISANPGDVAGVDQLATECAALSENFVTVVKEIPDGGEVSLADGTNEITVCPMDGVPDLVEVVSTDAVGARFIYVVTTSENIILTVSEENTFNFDEAVEGRCRIWGLSYQGTLTAGPGDDATAVDLATGCFDLSDNFVTVIREEVMGGTVSLNNGATQTATCPGDGVADVLRFRSEGATGPSYTYVITDENNVILDFPADDSFDFEGAGVGVCRVWGLAFAGDPLALVGDTASTAQLATGCFSLSENFVTVIREIPVGGSVSLDDGTNVIDVCSGDDEADELVFTTTSPSQNYVYLITQEGFALQPIEGNSFDFNNALSGTYEVYGLAYTGDLSIIPGQDIFNEDLATSCFELSDTSITINVTQVDGGEITAENGATEVYLCPDNLEDGFVSFFSNSVVQDTNYVYVIATATDVILNVMDSASFDFGPLPLMELRVYAISYTGDLLAGPGTSILFSQLATGCVSVSNFVTIFNDNPEAGEISFVDVPPTNVSCSVDGDGTIAVATTSTSVAGYAILVTDENNIIQLIATDPNEVDLGSLPEGDYRVWGLSYTGNIIAQVGDDAAVVALADNCYELTSDFLTVRQGGSITAGSLSVVGADSDTLSFCIPAGNNPIVLVEASVSAANYRYVVTDENGGVLVANLPSGIIPFTAFPAGTYRIYGTNITGQPTISFGQNIETAFLSTECYAISSNFITVTKSDPDGGMVTTEDGMTEVTVEIDRSGEEPTAVLSFISTASMDDEYLYVVTDEENVILGTSADGTVDFGPAGPGVCRVWGLAYTGNVTAMVGDDADDTVLTDGCFALSDNFVTVTRAEMMEIGGGVFQDHLQDDVRSSVSLTAYPNPVSGGEVMLTLESDLPLPRGTVSVRDLNGRSYDVQPLPGGTTSAQLRLDISTLPAGMYFAQFQTEQGIRSVRFMKR